MHNLAVESELTAPKLFQSKRDFEQSSSDEDGPSVVEFPPTLVGEIASTMIPLRNPTPIPVRVRFGVAPTSASDKSETSDAESVRKRYVPNRDVPS